MKICYFGDYDPDYIRNDVILTGLRENSVDVLECNFRGEFAYFKLICVLFKPSVRSADILFIGSSDNARFIVLFTRLFWFKSLVWDMHYSIYDARVVDRALASAHGLKGWYLYLIEWFACRFTNLILLDTRAHVAYIESLFQLKRNICTYVYTGANRQRLEVFLSTHQPALRSNKEFTVGFHGKYIPLQGVPYIIRAAKLLESDPIYQFVLVGSGQTYNTVQALARELAVTNVKFVTRVKYEMIPSHVRNTDVSLGIFGDTIKTRIVIPNKLYEAAALGVPVVSADTDAVREVFIDGEDIVLCKIADPEDLAKKIRMLAGDKALRDRIAGSARKKFDRVLSPQITGAGLKRGLENLLNAKK